MFECTPYAPPHRGGHGQRTGAKMKLRTGLAKIGVAALTTATPLALESSTAGADHPGHDQDQIRHVLLISVDGMHQSDLDWYAANHPNSELARLATGGGEYTNAQTPVPSDSDPGGTGLMTGADPKTLGI